MSFWNSISLRERVILILGITVILILAADSLVLAPYQSHQQDLKEQIEQGRQDLSWIQNAVHRLPSSPSKSNRVKGRLISFVDQQIGKAGLKKNMKQMTPVDQHNVRVRFSGVEFNKLIQLLNQMSGVVEITEARVLPDGKTGIVSASLILASL
jgi:type II secretory pathway component PulM